MNTTNLSPLVPTVAATAGSSSSPISIHLTRTLFVSGCAVEGEVELNFRRIHEDNVQSVHVKLRGSAYTSITRDRITHMEVSSLVRSSQTIWSRGSGVYAPPGSDILRIPFRLQLPPNLPPSFHYNIYPVEASIKYSLTAVGVRQGFFHLNRNVRMPLAVVPKDSVGIRELEKLPTSTSGHAYEYVPMRTLWKEDKIRRGLWGDYATVRVELSIADLAVYPLFVPIPFEIRVKTVTPPISRAKADAYPPDKAVFPPVPTSFSMVQLKLKRKLHVRAQIYRDESTCDVSIRTTDQPIRVELPEKEWVVGEGAGQSEKAKTSAAKGTWVQRATFAATFRLDCPPSFQLDTIKCEYTLELKIPFPGIGNGVRIRMPIIVTSGINEPIHRDGTNVPRPMSSRDHMQLDLPPAYWDVNSGRWGDEKE
ncbi:hypothetical protein C8Q73DRAFT_347945 [Cubamyces lactineus]|nr:hypothetical protein C8Q73DRAFT_347945 [Cubamyces lactineus]